MLTFLLAVPLEAITAPFEPETTTPTHGTKLRSYKHTSYQERFDSIVPCLLSSNEQIRRLATKVIDRIFSYPELMDAWKNTQSMESFTFKQNVWSLTWVLQSSALNALSLHVPQTNCVSDLSF